MDAESPIFDDDEFFVSVPTLRKKKYNKTKKIKAFVKGQGHKCTGARCKICKQIGKNTGRKPKGKDHQIHNKYMDYVLSYWEADKTQKMDKAEIALVYGEMPTFEKFMGESGSRAFSFVKHVKTSIVKKIIQKEYEAMKPNIYFKKWSNLNPERVFAWIQLFKSVKEKKQQEIGDAEKKFYDNMKDITKEELVGLKEILSEFYLVEYFRSIDWGYGLGFGDTVKHDSDVIFAWREKVNTLKLRDCFQKMDNFMDQVDIQGEQWGMKYLFDEVSNCINDRRTCQSCKKNKYNSQCCFFSRTTYKHRCTTNLCEDCMPTYFCERIKTNAESKDAGNKGFHGEQPKMTFVCGHACNCLYNPCTDERQAYFQKTTGHTKDELMKYFEADYKLLIFDKLKQTIEALRKDSKHLLPQDAHFHRQTFGLTEGHKLFTEHQELVTEADDWTKLINSHTYMDKLSEHIETVNTTRRNKESSLLETQIWTLVSAVNNLLQNTPKTDIGDRLCGKSTRQWCLMVLNHARECLIDCYENSRTCAICQTVFEPKDFDQLFATHNHLETKADKWRFTWNTKHNFKKPCYSCKDCFTNYLKFNSSLGKPELKCPGMNCSGQLEEKRIREYAPKGIMLWKEALMKFQLKKTANFRFCPMADCGAGLVLDNVCKKETVGCVQCDHKFCPHCNDSPHPGMDCSEMQKVRHAERWGESAKYMEKPTNQCPYCLVWIEKNGGCNHMTCQHCSGEFCWLCFGVWSNHNSCSTSTKVVRKPFNEYYPDWQAKPSKIQFLKYNVGQGVLVKETKEEGVIVGRTFGKHSTYEVQFGEGTKTTQFTHKDISPVKKTDFDRADIEFESFIAYASFLSGFASDDSDDDNETEDIGALLRYFEFIKGFGSTDFSDCETAHIGSSDGMDLYTEDNYKNFLSGFGDDDEDDSSSIAAGGLFGGSDSDDDDDSDQIVMMI